MPKHSLEKHSLDEILTKRKDYVRSAPAGGDMLVKAFRAPPSWNPELRSARFVMSDESVDRMGDIVIQQGLDLTEFLKNPQGLLFHNSRSFPIGRWESVEKVLTGRPKRTEGDLVLLPEGVDPDADRSAGHLAHGTLRAVSIGFMIRDWEAIVDDKGSWSGGFRITDSELVECSLVPVPALQTALAKDVAGDWTTARTVIEEVLDTWARHPETGLIVPRADYEAALKEMSGNRISVTLRADDLAAVVHKAIDETVSRVATKDGEGAAVETPCEDKEKDRDEEPSRVRDPAPVAERSGIKDRFSGLMTRIGEIFHRAAPAPVEPATAPCEERPALTPEQRDAITRRIAEISSRAA